MIKISVIIFNNYTVDVVQNINNIYLKLSNNSEYYYDVTLDKHEINAIQSRTDIKAFDLLEQCFNDSSTYKLSLTENDKMNLQITFDDNIIYSAILDKHIDFEFKCSKLEKSINELNVRVNKLESLKY